VQLSARRQVGALSIFGNYTFSKSLDNISVEGNSFTSPIDNFNLRLNKARGDYDRPHSFNAAFTYTLPVGRGHLLAGGAPRWVDTIIGGWDVGVTNFWQSGSTFTVASGRQTAGAAINTWANYAGDRKIGSIQRLGDRVIFWTADEIARFTFPNAGEIGTSGRNAFRGPRVFNTDLSLVKRFRLTEKYSISLRAEAYNLFNNVNFAVPGASVATPQSLGRISATIGNPRFCQMALRFDF
jgi:hypothetical protein